MPHNSGEQMKWIVSLFYIGFVMEMSMQLLRYLYSF